MKKKQILIDKNNNKICDIDVDISHYENGVVVVITAGINEFKSAKDFHEFCKVNEYRFINL